MTRTKKLNLNLFVYIRAGNEDVLTVLSRNRW